MGGPGSGPTPLAWDANNGLPDFVLKCLTFLSWKKAGEYELVDINKKMKDIFGDDDHHNTYEAIALKFDAFGLSSMLSRGKNKTVSKTAIGNRIQDLCPPKLDGRTSSTPVQGGREAPPGDEQDQINLGDALDMAAVGAALPGAEEAKDDVGADEARLRRRAALDQVLALVKQLRDEA